MSGFFRQLSLKLHGPSETPTAPLRVEVSNPPPGWWGTPRKGQVTPNLFHDFMAPKARDRFLVITKLLGLVKPPRCTEVHPLNLFTADSNIQLEATANTACDHRLHLPRSPRVAVFGAVAVYCCDGWSLTSPLVISLVQGSLGAGTPLMAWN